MVLESKIIIISYTIAAAHQKKEKNNKRSM